MPSSIQAGAGEANYIELVNYFVADVMLWSPYAILSSPYAMLFIPYAMLCLNPSIIFKVQVKHGIYCSSGYEDSLERMIVSK